MAKRRTSPKLNSTDGYGFHVVADPLSTSKPATIVGAIVTGPVAPFFEGVLGPSFDEIAAALYATATTQIASVKSDLKKKAAAKKRRRKKSGD